MKHNTGQANSILELLLTDKEIVNKIGKPLAKRMLMASNEEYTAEREAGITSIAPITPLQINMITYINWIQGHN